MRVELRDQDGTLGEVNLVDGVAVPSNELARRTMAETKFVLPGRPPTLVTPEDGERYLKGMSLCLRGTYFFARLIDP